MKRNTFSLLTIAVIALLFVACGSNKVPKDLSTLEKKIELKKSPCFGSCPVFNLTLYDKGVLEYHGIQNVEKLGYYTRIIPVKAYNKLIETFEAADLDQFDDDYPNQIVDFPTFKITFHSEDGEKTISGNEMLPEAVRKLVDLFSEYGDQGEWERK